MNSYLKNLSANLAKKIKKKAFPSFEKPMLATLTKNYFSSTEWIFERKFDGQRCLIFKNGSKVILKSRNNNILNATYPMLVKAAQQWNVDQVIVDGEVVAFAGKTMSFSNLQPHFGTKNAEKISQLKTKIDIYLFDILYLDGYELLQLPLLTRKTLLKKNIPFKSPIRYTTHINTKGLPFFKKSCRIGWEGIIAKKKDSTYVHTRSQNWLKFKCVANQEMVIAGYTDPQHSRIGFGALLLGYYDKGKLHFAGKVGTGFSDQFLQDFFKKLKKIEIKKNPFTNVIAKSSMHFVKPIYVAEIGFEEWTKDNKLRHPRFQGLRTDKSAKKVIKEKPKAIKI